VGLFATIISELCKNKKECTTKQNRAKITLTANVQSLVWQHDSKARLSCFLQVCSSSSSSASYIKNNQCRIAWKLLYIEDAELQTSISQYDASLYFLVRAYSYSSTSSSFHTNALPPQAALPAARAQNRCLINHLIESWAAKLIFSIQLSVADLVYVYVVIEILVQSYVHLASWNELKRHCDKTCWSNLLSPTPYLAFSRWTFCRWPFACFQSVCVPCLCVYDLRNWWKRSNVRQDAMHAGTARMKEQSRCSLKLITDFTC
jgi:hypothetical protein